MKTAQLFLLAGFVVGVSTLLQKQTVREGFSTTIACNLRQVEPPLWLINGSYYELFSIPQELTFIPVVNNYTELTIPSVPLSLNDVTFQCISLDAAGIAVKLTVLPRCSTTPPYTCVDSPDDIGISIGTQTNLLINYQQFDITRDSVTIGWTATSTLCGSAFELEGYMLSSVQAGTSNLPAPPFSRNVEFRDIGNIEIASDWFTSNGEPVVYRLVLMNANGVICSDIVSQKTFYKFNATDLRKTSGITSNSTAFYDIPMTKACTMINFVWQKDFGSNMSCVCPVSVNITSCGCWMGAAIRPQQDKRIRLSDQNSRLNGSVLHFQCSTSCNNTYLNDDCYLQTILSTHKIIISGPPSAPAISYNSSNGALCFSAYSHTELPVQNFTVEVTDATGILSDLSDAYITGSPLCLTVTSDPTRTPNVCSPFRVSATAWNAIGNSSSVMNFPLNFTNNDDELQSSCSCHQERAREQTVSVSRVTANSATLTLTCGLDQTDSIDHILVGGDRSRQIELFCGSSWNLTDLTPDTNYVLQRLYSDDIRCSVSSFTTLLNMPTPSAGNTVAVPTLTLFTVVVTINSYLVN